MSWWGRSDYYKPYVSADERRRRAEKAAAKLVKSGATQAPVRLEGKAIARSFWGKAWCANLESYSDYSNRMPRGRSYVRNGSVIHLEIRQGEIEALVSGSRLYSVKIKVTPVKEELWKALCRECAGGIGSLMELLGGKISERVMGIMTRRDAGLFPSPKEIILDCSCPDWAEMCKHVAAALYGVGARLDEKPELLFLLRHVSHQDLVNGSAAVAELTGTKTGAEHATLSTAEIGEVFGIEMEAGGAAAVATAPGTALPRTRNKAKTKPPVRKTTKKSATGKSRERIKKRKLNIKSAKKPRVSGRAGKTV
ncbi:MAG TPA: hypothetical protein DCS63_08565 [Elusimicrobia bacterium]|nr:hypothetical protein [Elusimicrobiota bacterium]